MANVNLLSPIIRKWEGGFVNDPLDNGGATNMGVTLSTWRSVGYDKDGDGDIDDKDIKALTPDDFTKVLKVFWDRWKADQINNQSVANILVDWVWGSGKWGIKIPQRILGVQDDGVVGQHTLDTLNAQDPKAIFDKIFQARVHFLNDICVHNPSQNRFLHGWMNRLNSFQFSD
jgi:lysozyme family protein